MRFLSGKLLVVAASGLTLATAFSARSYAKDVEHDYRNARYCEVVLGYGLKASVYTSFNLNQCPQSLWSNINSSKVKRQNRATFVYLNGPRHFLMDDFTYKKSSMNNDLRSFGGIKMHKAAIVKVTLSDMVKGFRPYKEHVVQRENTWVFKKGRPIYELISPQNKVYVMQSYSNEIIKQDERSLAKLGRKLNLPQGWRFKTGILKKDAYVATQNHQAIITQDKYKNTYQLASRDYLG